MVYFLVPETAGLSLEMLDVVFMDDTTTPVKRAAELRHKIRRGETVQLQNELEMCNTEKATVQSVENVEPNHLP